MTYERIPDESRAKIRKEDRCEISYNGYHAWQLLRDFNGQNGPLAVCKKCLTKREVNLTEKSAPDTLRQRHDAPKR